MDRQRFIVAGFSAAAVGSALQYAVSNTKGYRPRTRTYNGATIGPKIETRSGETLVMRIVNRLPPNPPAQPPRGRVRIPHVRNSMEAMDAVTRFPTRLSTRVSSMNDPHGFNTTNLHVHGIQTTPHIFAPLGTTDPRAMMIAIEPGKDFLYRFPISADHPSGLH